MKYTTEHLAKIVKDSVSIASVLKALGLTPAGGNYQWIKSRFKRDKIDTSHFSGQSSNKGPNHKGGKRLNEIEVLTNSGKDERSGTLRRCLFFIERSYKCSICSLKPEWQGKKLVLPVDHINGDRTDNRPENLRFLCPNCHSQTDTYCSKNKNRYKKE